MAAGVIDPGKRTFDLNERLIMVAGKKKKQSCICLFLFSIQKLFARYLQAFYLDFLFDESYTSSKGSFSKN